MLVLIGIAVLAVSEEAVRELEQEHRSFEEKRKALQAEEDMRAVRIPVHHSTFPQSHHSSLLFRRPRCSD